MYIFKTLLNKEEMYKIDSLQGENLDDLEPFSKHLLSFMGEPMTRLTDDRMHGGKEVMRNKKSMNVPLESLNL